MLKVAPSPAYVQAMQLKRRHLEGADGYQPRRGTAGPVAKQAAWRGEVRQQPHDGPCEWLWRAHSLQQALISTFAIFVSWWLFSPIGEAPRGHGWIQLELLVMIALWLGRYSRRPRFFVSTRGGRAKN